MQLPINLDVKARSQQAPITFKPCNNDLEDKCGICLDVDDGNFLCHEYKDEASNKNKHSHHLFCTSCITDWTYEQGNNPTCPICRKSYQAKDLLGNQKPSSLIKRRISHLRSFLSLRLQILSGKIYRPMQSYFTILSSVALVQLLNGANAPTICIAHALAYTIFARIVKNCALNVRPDLMTAEHHTNRVFHYIKNPLAIGIISAVTTKYLLMPAFYLSQPMSSIYAGAIGAFFGWKIAV